MGGSGKVRSQDSKPANIAPYKKSEEYEMKDLTTHISSEESEPLEKTDASILSRRVTKPSKINNAEDFANWLTNECDAASKKAFKPNYLIKKVSLVIAMIMLDVILTVIAFFIISALLSVMIPVPALPLALFFTGMAELVILEFVLEACCCGLGTINREKISVMATELVQDTIRELFQNDKFSDMNKEGYRELAKAISARLKQSSLHGYNLVSKLKNCIGEIDYSEDKNKTLQEITAATTNFIKIVFDELENDIKDEATKKYLATAKQEFASRQHDPIRNSSSSNKFITGIYDVFGGFDGRNKDEINLEKKEIEDAVQQGLKNYFSNIVKQPT